ncbi:hypothetical protein [Haloimpatiens massiliensis]|uniref:hypothetical protein n=1 Tax=Haloimpatiens massiliensis TaxID=1658110 RepID=UPI000C8241D8|nr:hypothetical protein [Haloimpatiens massiliensis]
MNLVYHGSPSGGLRVIRPHVSTHGEAYVYATKNKALALLFLQRWNDFIFNVAYGYDSILEITERYEGALEEILDNKKGYIYTLDGSVFLEEQTRFEGEVVSKGEAQVINGEKIQNILEKLMAMEKQVNIRIYRYPRRHPDIPSDDSDLVEEAVYFYKQGKTDIIDYCIKKHPKLKDKLKEAYRGNEYKL